jgi:hypothetical protein
MNELDKIVFFTFTPRNLISWISLLLLLLVPWRNAIAQGENPQPIPFTADSWTGDVLGAVNNLTRGEPVAEIMDIMLHGWDQLGRELVMLHGLTSPDGSFRFENVPFYPSVSYVVMVTYQEVTYFSEVAQLEAGQDSLEFVISVYETTDDANQISIDQKYTLFLVDQAGLSVTEVYILSNNGVATVKDTEILPSGRKGALKFTLPENANNVNFNSQSPERFILLPGGFLDANPLPPGFQVTQVMVSYNLPYESGLTFTYQAPYPTFEVNWLLQQGSGLVLQGDKISPQGIRSMGSGMEFEAFSSGSLPHGGTSLVQLSGKPNVEIQANIPATRFLQENSTQAVIVGSLVLGLSLLGIGVWWWRRPEDTEDDVEELAESTPEAVDINLEEVITRIALLDCSFERGELSEEAYRTERFRLIQAAGQASLTVDQDPE